VLSIYKLLAIAVTLISISGFFALFTYLQFQHFPKTITVTTYTPVARIGRGSVELVRGAMLFTVLDDLLRHANRSILVAVTLVNPYTPVKMRHNPVEEILQDLCYARKRGVVVRVLLDQETARDSIKVINELSSCGVDVRIWMWPPKMYSGIVVVDGRYVVVTPSVWSVTSLVANEGPTLVFESPRLAHMAERWFDTVWNSLHVCRAR